MTSEGLYEFQKMSFGLVNSPAVFNEMMKTLARRLRPGDIVCYMDDVMIPSNTFEKGMEKLERFLREARKAGIPL